MLEKIILLRQMQIIQALRTAMGMSLISMLCMEVVLNIFDLIITGEAYINFYIAPLMLIA